ncbi:accessory gene regulator B family protein [Macrococcus equi]|uniref:accessory gene regulator B family protein n=1 Tax=Macrococcus equi TaxID=3395462 RepID=UPI0039BE54A8
MSRSAHGGLSEIERLKFKRGLQVIGKNLLISFTIYFTSFCLNILLQVFVIHFCYFIIRYFSFGAHLKNFYLCIIQSLITFVFIPYCIIHYAQDIHLTGFGIGAAILIIILGPQPTKAQPIHDYMLKSLHIKTVITVLVLLCMVFILPAQYGTLIYYGIITQSITLIITYIGRKRHA